MASIKFVPLFLVCALADQSPWEGVNCGNVAVATDVCQYGLEFVYEDPADLNSGKKCCQKGMDSTFDDCKCIPCGITCDSTQSVQSQAYTQYRAMNFPHADAKAASGTYICSDSIFWQVEIPSNIEPVFKCCLNVQEDHKCNCPPKDDTKKCYSKWSNPDLSMCDFGQSTTGEYCCLKNGVCASDAGSIEGYTDWAGCWGSTEDECQDKATKTRQVDGHTQTSGCVYDVAPTQKYCGLEVTEDTQCQDPRPRYNDNNCGLSAVSDTEWFVNRRLDAQGKTQSSRKSLKFLGVQAIQGATGYCGSWWLENHSSLQKSILA